MALKLSEMSTVSGTETTPEDPRLALSFLKINGLGNDFVFVNDMDRTIELSVEQVQFLCDRHFGIGADGVILVRPSDRPECVAYMHYINSDGTLAQMCGNGVRCFAKYLVDNGMVDSDADSLVADTMSGPKPIDFVRNAQGRLVEATVNMGAPILQPDLVPTTLAATSETEFGTPYVADAPLESPWGTFAFTCVSMGNPHAVCFIDDFSALPDELFSGDVKSLETMLLDGIGAYFESHPAFPEKTNVEFAEVRSDGMAMRVYERGCGETLACGTGTCATNVAAALTGRAGRENDVELLGGTLHIAWGDDGNVYMTGPAVTAYGGDITVRCVG